MQNTQSPSTVNEWQQYIVDKYFTYRELDLWRWAREFKGVRDKVVVHIPARSGSTRLKDKNIADLCGHPLLAYTIALAKSLPVDRVIVNTDSKKYAQIAESYGAEVPFLRPKALSSDKAIIGLANFFAQRFLLDEQYPVKIMIEMYPTSLFRNLDNLKHYLKKTLQSGYCATCIKSDLFNGKIYNRNEKIELSACEEQIKGYSLLKPLPIFIGQKLNYDEISWLEYLPITNPVEMIDIDTAEDLEFARFVIENGLYDFGVTL